MNFRKAAALVVLPATAFILNGCALNKATKPNITAQQTNQMTYMVVFLDDEGNRIPPELAKQLLEKEGMKVPTAIPGQNTSYVDQSGAPVSLEAAKAMANREGTVLPQGPKPGTPTNPVGQPTIRVPQTEAELDSLQLPSPPWAGKADNVRIITESGRPFLPPKGTSETTANQYQINFGNNKSVPLPAGSVIYNNNVNPGDETTITLCVDREGNPVYVVSPLLHFLFQTSGFGSTSGNRKNDGYNVMQLRKLLDRYNQLKRAGLFHVIDKKLRERLDEYGLKHPNLSEVEQDALKKAREKGVFGQRQASLGSTHSQPRFRGKAGKLVNAMNKNCG